MEARKTPLYETHLKAGGKMVEFAGYILPVQYPTGVVKEHLAVRNACGLFDVSHMGELRLKGPDAVRNLNHLLTNDYTEMADGQCRYSPMCYPDGGTVDDLIVYKKGKDDYLIVVNAANRKKDVDHIREKLVGDVLMEDVSDSYAQLALQGPKAEAILSKLVPAGLLPEKSYTAVFDLPVGGLLCIVSRTGYTGSDGFELYTAAENAEKLFGLLMEAGKEEGLIPCGLGARDTLRLEASMPLYGHELSAEITPLEAGLSFFVHLDKDEFIGKEALEKAGRTARVRVGLKVTGRGIVREHQDVFIDGRKVGVTTSGTSCPYVGYPAAMALIERASRKIGTKVEVDVRGRLVEAEIVKMPFYKKEEQ